MEDSHRLFPVGGLLILLGAVFPAYGVDYLHHGPYAYGGNAGLGGYQDPESALYQCQIYRSVEGTGQCHTTWVGFDVSQVAHEGAAGMCGGSDPFMAWWYNTGQNAYRFFWFCQSGSSGDCPQGMESGAGADGACGYPPQQCPTGDEQRFHGDAGEPIPENVCSNGCWYEAKYDDVPVTFKMGTHAWSGNFISTGNACEAGGGPGGPPDNPPENCISDNYGNTFCTGIGPGNAPPNCMEADGNQACLDAYDPMNCGYINGEPVCFDDYPDEGICEFLPGGSYICFSGDQEPQSPPYPDTGTPGEAAEPDVEMQKGDGEGGPGHSLDYFNSDTIDQSSGEGGAPGPNSDKSTPDKLEIEGPVEVEVKDPVKIDEEGTPQQSASDQTIFDDIFNQTGINDLESQIADIGAGTVSPIPSVPSTLSDIDELFPSPQSCADPQLNFFGSTMIIPFASMGQGLRDVLGWAFYIMTGLYLFGLVMSLPAKVK